LGILGALAMIRTGAFASAEVDPTLLVSSVAGTL
jgi:hypothetical protein